MTASGDIISVRDAIIDEFCSAWGSKEKGLTVVKEQFDILNADFESPTKEQLAAVLDYLAILLRLVEDETSAEGRRQKALKMINGLN